MLGTGLTAADVALHENNMVLGLLGTRSMNKEAGQPANKYFQVLIHSQKIIKQGV